MRNAGRTAARAWCLAMAVLVGYAAPVVAQAGGPFAVRRSTIDGGGASVASGGAYRAGATIGQPETGQAAGSAYLVGGGFWGGGVPVQAPTPTVTATGSPTRTASSVPIFTHTATVPVPPSSTPSVTVAPGSTPTFTATAPTPTRTAVPTATPSPTSSTATPSPTPTETPFPPACAGDCDASGAISVDELLRGVNIALDRTPLSICTSFDGDRDGRVAINEMLAAVNAALNGCSDLRILPSND
jgi:hypothetical protein